MECSRCKKEKEVESKRYCKSCQSSINYISNKRKIEKISLIISEVKIKYGGECKKCNENRQHLLDFHHLNPKEKDNDVPSIIRYYGFGEKSIKRMEEEIKKCILLCSNCHRDFHYQERTNNITIEEYLQRCVSSVG